MDKIGHTKVAFDEDDSEAFNQLLELYDNDPEAVVKESIYMNAIIEIGLTDEERFIIAAMINSKNDPDAKTKFKFRFRSMMDH